MVRSASFPGAFCLALLLPALADAQGSHFQNAGTDLGARLATRPLAAPMYTAVPTLPPAGSPLDSCRADTGAEAEPPDPRWQWRLRALRHLDCVTALVDDALAAGAGDREGPRQVRIAREDLERIRTLAWWAREAAARIGQ